MKHNMVNPRIE